MDIVVVLLERKHVLWFRVCSSRQEGLPDLILFALVVQYRERSLLGWIFPPLWDPWYHSFDYTLREKQVIVLWRRFLTAESNRQAALQSSLAALIPLTRASIGLCGVIIIRNTVSATHFPCSSVVTTRFRFFTSLRAVPFAPVRSSSLPLQP